MAARAEEISDLLQSINEGLVWDDTPNTPSAPERGRPAAWVDYDNAHSCYVMSRLRAIGLGQTQIQHVLDTFLNSQLDLQKCAPTYHLLEQIEKKTVPSLPTYSRTVGGVVVHYKKPTDIATLLLSDPEVDKSFDWTWSYNSGIIQEAHHTDGWLDLIAHFWPFVAKGYRPLHYYIYRDGFNQLRHKHKDVTGIYMRFAGDKKRRVFPLCFVPAGCKVHECMDLIEEDLVNFEQGFTCLYGPTKRMEIFYGGLFQETGDHVDAAHGAGVKGSTARRPCRYCDLLLVHFHLPHAVMVAQELAVVRDAEMFEQVVREAQALRQQGHGFQGAADTLLKESGYLETLPSIFLLPSAKREWFRKFNICPLHALQLGIVKRFLINLGRVLGKSTIEDINAAVIATPKIPGVPHLSNGIYRIVAGKKVEQKITTQPLVGDEYVAFMKISMVIFRGFNIPEPFLCAWDMLLTKHFMLSGRPFSRDALPEWFRVCIRTQEAVVEAFTTCVAEDGTPMFSSNFVNTHAVREHFVQQILWLGPPSLQSTQTWERQHQDIKEHADNASHKDLQKSVFTMFDHSIGWEYVRTMPDMEMFNNLVGSTSARNNTYTRHTMVRWLGTRPLSRMDIHTMSKSELPMETCGTTAREYSGFRIATGTVHVADWVQVGESATPPHNDGWKVGLQFGKVLQIFEVPCLDKKTPPLQVVKVEPWEVHGPCKYGLSHLRRKADVPMVYHRIGKVSRILTVHVDPRNQHERLINHWVSGRYWCANV